MTARPAAAAPPLRRWLRARRHTVLLVALVVFLGVRPIISDSTLSIVLYNSTMLLLLLVALMAVNIDATAAAAEGRRRRPPPVLIWMLAAAALGERLLALLASDLRTESAAAVIWLLFLAYVTVAELRIVLSQRAVSGETISMAVSVYLLIGVCLGLFYYLLHLHRPDAFTFNAAMPTDPQARAASFILFSLAMLSTNGLGDITPVILEARYIVVAEGILGQFYLAVLVARLVSLQITAAPANDR